MKSFSEKKSNRMFIPIIRENEKEDHLFPKILAVDDRPENLMALKAVLSGKNYHLVFASSGEEALRKVLQDDFALILLDVQMPGIDGFETARLIKQREKSHHIPIIFITALSQAPEHVANGYACGALDYIFKPFEPETLRKKVDGFIQIFLEKKEIENQHEMLQIRAQELEDLNLELQDKEKHLERMIEERTADLLKSNHSLKMEVVERQKVEQELRNSQEHFRKIFELSPNLMTIRTIQDKRFINVNKSWLTRIGIDSEEWIEWSDQLIFFKEESELSLCYIEAEHPLRNIEITFRTKEGEVRDGLLSTELMEVDREICVLAVVTDITELLKLKKELTRLDRLNLVGEMAAGIAHEIRNPLTTVRGFLQINKENPSPQYIDLMIDELDRANQILNEYLSLAKNKRSEKQPHVLNEILKTLFPLLHAEAVLKGKSITMDLMDDRPFPMDQKEIRQLVLNLSLNGLESMGSGGHLSIHTYQQEGRVILEVSDQGSGISPELLDKIGTPFMTTKEKGTGLGLAVCYSVAARHDAKIEIQTGSSGTTFMVSFSSIDTGKR